MNRPFKFRAFNHSSKEMYYETKVGDVFKWHNEGQVQSIMQAIGKLDKEKKDIYEGDICDDGFGNKCKIEWQNDISQFLAVFDEDTSDSWQEAGEWCIVVGNIYQNPNLLT